MNLEDARSVLIDATKHIDWVNLGFVFSTLGEQGFSWGKYDGAFFRPNYARVKQDMKWLANNVEDLKQAIDYFKENKC